MSSGFELLEDPQKIATRAVTNETPLDLLLKAMYPEDAPEGKGSVDLETLLSKIPPREADLIEMYFLQHKKQSDIAAIFEVTQAAVSYRIDRGLERLRYLVSIPDVTEEDMRRDLALLFLPEDPKSQMDIDILVHMWLTTCQSEVAKRLNLTQGRVRHRFFKAIKALDNAVETIPQLAPYNKIFQTIANKNFNIMREVTLPQWSGRGGNICYVHK